MILIKIYYKKFMNEIILSIISELNSIAPYVAISEAEAKIPFADYDIHLDSLDVVSLLIAIEEKFDISFDTDEYLQLNELSIYSLAELVMEKKCLN